MAITRQPRQFLAVWNDNGTEVKGATFEESFLVDGGLWKNELTSVEPEGFAEFGALFSNQLQIQNDTLVAELAAANARVALLIKGLPFNPRVIDATAFYNRLTKDELLVFVSSSDTQVRAIGQTIAAYKANDWPVVFESTEFQKMVGYLLEAGVVTSERLAELTKDAIRDEAYVAS
jgi:hypothetical protein